MKLAMRWSELARVCGGRLTRGDKDDFIDVISTDTRTLKPGDAYWALRGENFDGHAFLSESITRQASGWVVASGRPAPIPPAPHVVEVPDTLKALQSLAHAHRLRFDIPVAAIVGSNGKTTTKEMLSSICAQVGPVCATPGNWNNEIGVPLSILRITAEHRHALFELAACRKGEIAELASIASPSVAVMTNIGPDHLGTFGSIETTFQTNSEVIDALPHDGVAIINIDDPWLSALETRLGSRALTYGQSQRCRIRIESPTSLLIDRHRIDLALKSYGAYSLYNAAAAAAAAWAMGISPDAIRAGLNAHTPAMLRQETLTHPSGALIILDAYNANPASMRASISAFCEKFMNRPKILVLGDMKELGAQSGTFHADLVRWLATLELKRLYLCGPEMSVASQLLSELRPRFDWIQTIKPEECIASIKAALSGGDALLFKGSRAMRLEELAKAI